MFYIVFNFFFFFHNIKHTLATFTGLQMYFRIVQA